MLEDGTGGALAGRQIAEGFEDVIRKIADIEVNRPDPLDITANLKAPILILDGRGYQVINTVEEAPLRAPLFVLPERQQAATPRSADAA